MARIYLTTRPFDAALLSDPDRAFAVVAPGYPTPVGLPVVELATLLERREEWLGAPGTMVVVGLSRLMTPSNRVKLGQVLLRPRPHLHRISVDEVLFVSEPWRMWWHFYAVGAERWGFTDSFLAETRWKNAHELRTSDPFGVEAVLRAMDGVVAGDEPFRFPEIEVETIEAPSRVHADYAAVKEEAFANEKTVAGIIRRLAAFAQQAEPRRAVPTPARLFRRGAAVPRIVATDLPVDRYLVAKHLEYVTLTNAIADKAEAAGW